MGLRVAALASLAAIVIWTRMAGSAQVSPPLPPPMFSPWYGEALRGVLQMEEADVARLEAQLAANPEDFPARLKLMAYHQRADRVVNPGDRAKRVRHALWLIEHHPESELLHSPVSRFSRGELNSVDYQRAVALWDAAAKTTPGNAAVPWNAASFFQGLDSGLYMHYLEATAAADPNHPFALRPLSSLYAQSVLEGGPLSSRAQAGLEASKNVWVLSNAAYAFQSEYNRTLQMGMRNTRAAELAERYFLRAQALDPNLDRSKILPQIDMQKIRASWEAGRKAQEEYRRRAVAEVGRIQRLPLEAFPELPAAVVGVLRARGCSVPQPFPDGAPRNVIRGEFFAKGEAGWAVLCSVNNSTTLLAFRNDRDANPDALAASDDLNYMQGIGYDRIGYSHQITAVGREFMMEHYRAYGGVQPPPIDHHGIDDAFLEKASITWYFHEGKWLQLQGAD
ncbi:MAG TPA: hypothetical protein VLH09_14255 [Bryobacteraceae bacterium]|nr:hypothetical protein [Bryobacteraceae bacterium]